MLKTVLEQMISNMTLTHMSYLGKQAINMEHKKQLTKFIKSTIIDTIMEIKNGKTN